MIELREVNRHNFEAVIDLKVGEAQQSFVAPNVLSLAEAKVFPACVPLAVYVGDEPVGFVMYALDEDDGEYWIPRLMIDEAHQGRGYGRAALRSVLEIIQQDEMHGRVFLSFEPENEGAKKLYESMGFQPDGRVLEGEIVYYLQYR